MDQPKPGEIVTDGKSVNIGAPTVRGTGTAALRTPSQAIGQAVRHLKGVVTSVEELQKLLEEEEKSKP